MKKIDKLILTSFIGPFFMTFFVVVFILLTQHMLKYFDDIIGKDLGWGVIGSLLFYFGIFMTPVALPLAILLSSLITFGNLGEHFELTAVKSLGISLIRSLVPIFLFVLLLTVFAFWVNNILVPKAALEAYSLMYDIKQKKPALDLREGAFYNGIPDISIKINDRLKDQKTLMGVIIYDHRGHTGNKEVIMADSGKMYTILDGQYLKFELFRGYRYTEGATNERDISGRPATADNSSKTKFGKMQVVFDLSSFGFNRTDKKWFQSNRIMRNMSELNSDMDSVNKEINLQRLEIWSNKQNLFKYHFVNDTISLPKSLEPAKRRKDSLSHPYYNANAGGTTPYPTTPAPATSTKPAPPAALLQANGKSMMKSAMTAMNKDDGPAGVTPDYVPEIQKPRSPEVIARTKAKSDSIFGIPIKSSEYDAALGQARIVKSQFENSKALADDHAFRYMEFDIQWHKIFSNSIACIVMFLIGAPLGAIIKKGGLGVPVLVSITFFIVFYLITATGEKWAKQGLVSVPLGIWFADIVLLVIGLLFLRQARQDARLFDADFYNVVIDKLRIYFAKTKKRPVSEA